MMFCLDTYALVEISRGNAKFTKIFNSEFCIPNLIMAEFYGIIYRAYDEKTANYWFRKLSLFCKEIPMNILTEAVKYRIDHKQEKLSFFDCVAYIYAQRNNMSFVTGDKAFQKRKGVKFIK